MVEEFKERRDFRNNYAIFLKGVYTSYLGELNPAIKNINLKVGYGDFLLIVGPNGAGKTTLLETILGLLKPLKGEIWLLGYKIPKESRRARRYCSYIPQDFMKPRGEPFLVKDVVAMGLASDKGAFSSLSKDEWMKVYDVLKLFGIEDLAERPIGKLSGGQQQKVLLARIFVRKPKVIFLDEPFSSLDKDSRIELANILSEINKLDNVTILMVSHDISIIPEACRRVIRMENGTIVGEEIL